MKPYAILLAAGLLAACTSNAAYGPASKSGAMGYSSQQIETGRYQVSYTDSSPSKARDRAWFEITSSFAERSEDSRSGGSSVSIGGSSGSRGHSSVGVGVGIGIPLGGGNSGSVTEVLEIVTGKGDKPDRPSVYDARSVDINLRGSATE